jgi:hypothetical protein
MLTILGRYGCFVKTKVLFPLGEKIKMSVMHEGERFSVSGEIVHVVPTQGLGIAFGALAATEQELLEHWLSNDANDIADTDRRRERRVATSIQIQVAGQDVTGSNFQDQAVTADVSKHGCRFELLRQLQPGSEITIQFSAGYNGPFERSRQLFRVIWVEPSEYGWAVGAAQIN